MRGQHTDDVEITEFIFHTESGLNFVGLKNIKHETVDNRRREDALKKYRRISWTRGLSLRTRLYLQ